MLKIYNSLTKHKEIFKPLQAGNINLYVCGNTVYDYCHIGHARSMVVFDMMVRYLRDQGYDVMHVRNITDIDDKIIKRALEQGNDIHALTEFFIKAQEEDCDALGLLKPNNEPKATDYIPEMLVLVQQLLDKKKAYMASNGDVYFDVRSLESYGELSGRDIEKLKAGVRVEIKDVKRDPLDFALWKTSKPGEPHWTSPWGEGRPGWHLECSVMSTALLGQPFDIHGGGMDLKFPHHENEIAQSKGACDKEFANYWMHVGLLQINKEKMSKSLGNFITIRESLKDYPAEVLRYFMISGHYRSPVNYSVENMQHAQNTLEHLYLSLRGLSFENTLQADQYGEAFQAAMNDDFNTPEALAVLSNLAAEINRLREGNDQKQVYRLASTLHHLGGLLGILQENPEDFLRGSTSDNESEKIELLVKAREQARAEKNWAEADRLRDELSAMNIIIEDSTGTTRWRRQLK